MIQDRTQVGYIVEDDARDTYEHVSTASAPRYSRRLSDKILIAFHHACDQSVFDIAEQLLNVMETLLNRHPVERGVNRRRSMETLVAAHERLWHLKNKGETTI